MYKIIKRDGKIVDFDITKIANAIKKAISSHSRSRLTSCRR